MPVSLVPDRVLRHYTDVTPRLLGELGVKLLLCDLDYTLAPRSVSAPDGALRAWLDRRREAGVTVAILSNNRSPRRVEAFCGALGIWYVGHAGKPSVKGFRRAMEQAGAGPEETAMLGDKHRRAGGQAQRHHRPDGGAPGGTGRDLEPGAPRPAGALQTDRKKEK